jgi:hypothetical protein
VAVNVTDVAGHIGLIDATMLIAGTKVAETLIVIVFEVAGLPVTQVALEVITQVTISPFTKAALVYVVLLVPTFTPFNFH